MWDTTRIHRSVRRYADAGCAVDRRGAILTIEERNVHMVWRVRIGRYNGHEHDGESRASPIRKHCQS